MLIVNFAESTLQTTRVFLSGLFIWQKTAEKGVRIYFCNRISAEAVNYNDEGNL